ncbi:hypothetical protein B2J88_51120 [Rhodococcus sp. SRB_17]|uniref:Bug family tripartite tricarboxylate transporter substrate binding protein n=1 Tax=Acidovorax sp. SRB_24 TaxID=1962700 RepID=UPI00145E1D8A|nr:tripartite tricarboxylate transporter substrate binding protein [Acidovorax sp. SRB_24]NMM79022.1 hypothetical protein [Acidovorax sp. SRB_24]NMM92499.1 hypothetical protein [Rhodococcus sp. SRB_17]
MHVCLKAVLALAMITSLPVAVAQDRSESHRRLAPLESKDYPVRPIEVYVAYPAGGGMDVHARILVKYLVKHTGKDFVVMNKPGAEGLIGHSFVATQLRPDGYGMAVLSSNFWAHSTRRSEGKWGLESIEPVGFLNSDPLTWIVTTEGKFKNASIRDVLQAARNTPNTVRAAASPSNASGFLMEQVQAASGAKFNVIPYPGGKQALNDLMGGHIDVAYGFVAEYRSLLQAGKVRVLAATGAKRSTVLPEVPTFNEVLSADEILWDAFRFVALPRNVPEDRKRWLEEAVDLALDDPEMKKEIEKAGAIFDRSLRTSAQVAAEIRRRSAMESRFYSRPEGK